LSAKVPPEGGGAKRKRISSIASPAFRFGPALARLGLPPSPSTPAVAEAAEWAVGWRASALEDGDEAAGMRGRKSVAVSGRGGGV
jgi:hypothetical protein